MTQPKIGDWILGTFTQEGRQAYASQGSPPGSYRARSVRSSEQYDVVPPVFQVLQHVRFKYTCQKCDKGFKTAPGVAAPLPRCQVSPGFLDWLGTAKFVDFLPLYRQAAILEKRFGIPFNRTTLSDWMIKTADRLLDPLVKAMEPLLLGTDHFHNQWPKLICFMEDGRLGLDNNPAERHVRPVAVGRKNGLFCQSQAGAKAKAI